MIDVHSHIVFDVDDGPKTLEESLDLIGESYAIITHRDISVMGNLSESVWCWKSRRGHDWDYSINFLCKHKTVATLEPIRGVGQTRFLSYMN